MSERNRTIEAEIVADGIVETANRIAKLEHGLNHTRLFLGEAERDYKHQISELETAYQHTVEDNEDLVRQLDAVNEVIVAADTFSLNLSLPQVIRRLKTALQQRNDDE